MKRLLAACVLLLLAGNAEGGTPSLDRKMQSGIFIQEDAPKVAVDATRSVYLRSSASEAIGELNRTLSAQPGPVVFSRTAFDAGGGGYEPPPTPETVAWFSHDTVRVMLDDAQLVIPFRRDPSVPNDPAWAAWQQSALPWIVRVARRMPPDVVIEVGGANPVFLVEFAGQTVALEIATRDDGGQRWLAGQVSAEPVVADAHP